MTIDIPDKATNGDVMKIMFPDFEFKLVKTKIAYCHTNITMCCQKNYVGGMDFDINWWNAPYKESK